MSILYEDENENVLLTSIKKGENVFVLVLFIDNLMNRIDPFKNVPILLTGDINLITSTTFLLSM